MSLYSEHDDLDLRGVVVNWQKEISFGSFGVIFEGTWRDDSGNSCDVVVKVSARMKYVTDSKTTDAVLNGTLRCPNFLLHVWAEIRDSVHAHLRHLSQLFPGTKRSCCGSCTLPPATNLAIQRITSSSPYSFATTAPNSPFVTARTKSLRKPGVRSSIQPPIPTHFFS